MKNYGAAIKDFNECIDRDPSGLGLYRLKSLAYIYARDYENALTTIELALKVQRSFFHGRATRALVYVLQGQYEHALNDYLFCKKKIRINADGYYALMLLESAMNYPEDASHALFAIDHDPKYIARIYVEPLFDLLGKTQYIHDIIDSVTFYTESHD